MIRINNKTISSIIKDQKEIVKIYKNGRIVYLKISSNTEDLCCFSNGYWDDTYPWNDESAWKDSA